MAFWNIFKRKRQGYESFNPSDEKVTKKQLTVALDTLEKYSKQQETVKNGDSFFFIRFEEDPKGIFPKNTILKGTQQGIGQMLFSSSKKDEAIANIIAATYGAMETSNNPRFNKLVDKVNSLKNGELPDGIDMDKIKKAISEQTGVDSNDIIVQGVATPDNLEKMTDQEMDDFLDRVAEKTNKSKRRRRLDDDENESE
jgi:hypothetical protein